MPSAHISSCNHLQLAQRSNGFPDRAFLLYHTFNLSDFSNSAYMASIRLYERIFRFRYSYTCNSQKHLYARLAFVSFACLPLLVFRLHILKSRSFHPGTKTDTPTNKCYTSLQRPFSPSWYTDTTKARKPYTGHLWGCHGIPAHCSTPGSRQPGTLKRSWYLLRTRYNLRF